MALSWCEADHSFVFRAPICNQELGNHHLQPIEHLDMNQANKARGRWAPNIMCIYCTHHPKTAMEPQRPEFFLASKTLFRMGSKLPGISNHFHIDSGMKPETCHMSLCLMQRYSYTLFKTYQNCQRAMHMVCWINCLPCITVLLIIGFRKVEDGVLRFWYTAFT